MSSGSCTFLYHGAHSGLGSSKKCSAFRLEHADVLFLDNNEPTKGPPGNPSLPSCWKKRKTPACPGNSTKNHSHKGWSQCLPSGIRKSFRGFAGTRTICKILGEKPDPENGWKETNPSVEIQKEEDHCL